MNIVGVPDGVNCCPAILITTMLPIRVIVTGTFNTGDPCGA